MDKSECKKGDIAFFRNFVSPSLIKIVDGEFKINSEKGDFMPRMYFKGWTIPLIRDDVSKLYGLDPYSAFDVNGDIVSGIKDFYKKGDLYLPEGWVSEDALLKAMDYFSEL
jgi:hypothetical protein